MSVELDAIRLATALFEGDGYVVEDVSRGSGEGAGFAPSTGCEGTSDTGT